jgi:hypothetical protein
MCEADKPPESELAMFERGWGFVTSKVRVWALGGVLGLPWLMPGSAQATAPSMPAITFPVDLDSIGLAVGAAAGAIFLIWAIIYVPQKLLYRGTRRATGSA